MLINLKSSISTTKKLVKSRKRYLLFISFFSRDYDALLSIFYYYANGEIDN